MTILTANAAAMDKTVLSQKEKEMFHRHARQTASYYCTGCANHCESVLDCDISISDVMRGMMYAQGYGDIEKARRTSRQLQGDVLSQLMVTDYTAAEKASPNGIPMLMKAVPDLLA